MLTFLLNCSPLGRIVEFNGQKFFLAGAKGTATPMRPIDNNGVLEGTPTNYVWFEERDYSMISNEPTKAREADRFPPNHMREIARIHRGVEYVEDRAQMNKQWLRGIDDRVRELRDMKRIYLLGRTEKLKEDIDLIPENQDRHPETGRPFIEMYDTEIKMLEKFQAELKSQPREITQIMDAEEDIEIALTQKNLALQAHNKTLAEGIADLRTEMAEMQTALKQMSSKAGVSDGGRTAQNIKDENKKPVREPVVVEE